jgi:hypothetical protein
MDKIRNPDDNRDDIIAAIGSVAIYGPRDECPDFRYQLLNAHFYKEGEYGNKKPIILLDVNTGSGIINIEKAKKANKQGKEHKTIIGPDTKLNPNSTEIAIQSISNLYELSAFPEKKDIEHYLTMKWGHLSDVPVYNMLVDLNGNNLIHVSQSQLCGGGTKNTGVYGQHGISGRIRGEGVYYHNVCRSLPRINKSYETAWNTWRSGNKVSSILKNTRIYNSHFSELFKKRIPLLQNFYQSREFQNKQAQINENNCVRIEQNIIKKKNMRNKIKRQINEMNPEGIVRNGDTIEETREDAKYMINRDTEKAIAILSRTLKNKQNICARRRRNRNSIQRESRNRNSTRSGRNRNPNGNSTRHENRNRSPTRE